MEDRFATEVTLSNSDSDDSDFSPPNTRRQTCTPQASTTTAWEGREDNSSNGGRTLPGRGPSRPRSTSFLALKDAVYQLTCLNDFTREKIGYGFFADVYKVTHKTTGEVMVLKMNKCRQNSKQMLAEIQLMNRLSHKNILGFKGSCVHEGHLHALTEYVNGGNLEELLLDSNSPPLPWSTKIRLAHDIACGMSYLHSRGVFHRDLTSKNCLIHKSNDGSLRCVVADFGLAAKIKHKRRSYTETVGSPFWMAPECLKGKEYGEQSDVFSYGIVLAEIISQLSADPDFLPRTNQYGIDYDKLRKSCEGCPPELWDLMYRCSQLDPDDRPTFDEVVQLLETQLLPPSTSSCHADSTITCTCTTNTCTCTTTNDSSLSHHTHKSMASSRSHSEPIIITPVLRRKTRVEEKENESHDLNNHHLQQQHEISTCTSDNIDYTSTYNHSTTLSSRERLSSGEDLSSQLSSLLEGSTETDGIPQRKISILSHDSGCGQERSGDSGIDPDVCWRGLALAKTPSLGDTPTPLTPSSHTRQISNSSDVSFQLPSPSFAWAPPPSPCRSLVSPINVCAVGTCDGSSPERSPEFVRNLTNSGTGHRPGDDKGGVVSMGVVSNLTQTSSSGSNNGGSNNKFGLFTNNTERFINHSGGVYCSTPDVPTC